MAAEDDAEFVVPFDVGAGGGADVGEGAGAGVIRVASLAQVVDGREAARARGRALGLHEALLRGETGQTRDARVARAVRYAEKEFDGVIGRRAPRPTGNMVPSPFRPDPKIKPSK